MKKDVLSLGERIEYNALREGDSSIPNFDGRKVRSATFYIAGTGATILGLGHLIDADTNKKVGFTNFPTGNKLPKGMEIQVNAMRALFDKTTVSVTPLIAKWNTTPDEAWLNGNFSFEQGRTTFSTPITDLANIKASTSNDDDFRAIVPFTIREQVEFAMIAELAGAAAAGTAWRIEMRCDVYTAVGV